MAKTKRKTKAQELDSIYILKLVLFLILGSQWLRISWGDASVIPIPLGAIAGLFLARYESLRSDRKFEYAVLLTAMFIGFWLPLGIDVTI